MSSAHTITTNLPFGLFSAASLSGPLPAPSKTSSALFNIDDAGPATMVEEPNTDTEKKRLF